jgi:hypothetical protein
MLVYFKGCHLCPDKAGGRVPGGPAERGRLLGVGPVTRPCQTRSGGTSG